MIAIVEASGVRGRGGAGFPVGRKWRAVAERAGGDAVVVVNAAEGEPFSVKDRTLLRSRPHLVLDGAAVAAASVGAREVVVYIGRAHRVARDALKLALRERAREGIDACAFRIVEAPDRYVAGEESAVVHCINAGIARPTLTPPRPFERGVRNRPTLVQNTETMAHIGLIARWGAGWFREMGTEGSPGTALLSVCGAVRQRGVLELPLSATVGDALRMAGGCTGEPQAVLLGGFFGTWLPASIAMGLRLDDAELKAAGTSLGCGVVGVVPKGACGLGEGARILEYLAGETAGQCGPCVNGLAAISEALVRIVRGRSSGDDPARLERWAQQVSGRGACRHPDGAVRHLRSLVTTFADDLHQHIGRGPCDGAQYGSVLPPVPAPGRGWR